MPTQDPEGSKGCWRPGSRVGNACFDVKSTYSVGVKANKASSTTRYLKRQQIFMWLFLLVHWPRSLSTHQHSSHPMQRG
ncbi:hypothetical protein FOBRF1_003378 [Fusarium oxysporum]